jgi:hypothetical protein
MVSRRVVRFGNNVAKMAGGDDRVPKQYRNRLHRLKNAYRRAYRREPELERPVTEQSALHAIASLEEALRRAGVPVPGEETSRKRKRGASGVGR